MGVKETMAIVNRLAARRDRQKAALEITVTELAHWEAELEKLRKKGL